jgi:XTP/dITP diphosphohydrolase
VADGPVADGPVADGPVADGPVTDAGVDGQPPEAQPAEGQPPEGPPPGTRLLELVQVMDTLRRNCPWDARQTHVSLTPYLLEETYEAVDALASGDPDAVCEELGDVLLQVVFHARIAQERTDGTGYDIDDVADSIISKLTRRHPHVFGDVTVSGADEVTRNWDAIKASERAARRAVTREAGDSGATAEPGGAAKTAGSGGEGSGQDGPPPSALDGVPMSQPALSLAAQLLRRAGKAGAPPDLASAGRLAGRPGVSDLGLELLALVARAQEADLDPELELRAAARAYADGVRTWEGGSPPSP